MMGTYTCITCRVMFSGKDFGNDEDGLDTETRAALMQKEHYKTDWHRYNLKRKVASLPPVTAEDFQEKIIAHKSQLAEETKSTVCRCEECGRQFNTTNAYNNHLQSKKHKEMVASRGSRKNSNTKLNANRNYENIESDKRLEKDITNTKLKNAIAARKGSSATEQDVIMAADDDEEDWEDIDDDDGNNDDDNDVKADAVPVDHCLFCPEVSTDLESNLKHMTLAHSFFIPDLEYVIDLEGLVAYLGEKVGCMRMCLWCNERSRVYTELRAVQQHMTDKGHCKVFHEGDAVLEYSEFYDYRSSYPDYKPDQDNEDEPVTAHSLGSEEFGYQLVLPSGSTVGHRTLQRYYRQKLRPGRELVLHSNPESISKVMTHYKALGWLGTTGPAAMLKAKDIAYMNRMKSRHHMNLGIRQNKFQKHYRDDNFGTH